jgi:hypothetical protein
MNPVYEIQIGELGKYTCTRGNDTNLICINMNSGYFTSLVTQHFE